MPASSFELSAKKQAIRLAPHAGAADQFTSPRYVRALGQSIYTTESSGDVGDRKPSVLLHGSNDLNLVEETPDKTWSKFFPSVEWGKFPGTTKSNRELGRALLAAFLVSWVLSVAIQR
jgi:hypothetical protein